MMKANHYISHIIRNKTAYAGLLVVALISLAGCSKVLDKHDLNSFNQDQVFNDSSLARGYLSYLYDQDSPGWPSGDWTKCTDEISGETVYFDGTVQVNTVTDYGTSMSATNFWGKLRGINVFLQNVKAGTLNKALKKRLEGQALFFRAWLYFGEVNLYGGIPIVLTPQDAIGEKAANAAYVARNKTSECFAQMTADLDSAIAYLPGSWTSDDWGRITSGAAAALKGRILLFYASPQFNPDDQQARWQAAYNASKQAVSILTANGYGLNPDFQNMWFQEVGNPEAVWSVGYNTSQSDQLQKNDSWDNQTRPAENGTDGGNNEPISMIVNAFPMADGKMPGDPTSAYTYNSRLFYKNRGPRFYATIAYNGCTWPLNGNKDYKLWTYYVNGTSVEAHGATSTGFYCRKAIDPNLSVSNAQYAGTDWMEIRYAEVVLNLAESACGINKIGEAYQGLEQIRQRAGLPAGSDGLYGLTPNMSRDQMFKAILYERRIEFAFEGKRFWDLRRWKLFESTLNDSVRTGITIDLNTPPTPNSPRTDSTISASDFAAVRDTMSLDYAYEHYFTTNTKVLDTKYKINWQPNYYFFAIPQKAMDNNPKLLQTQGWPGGTFDPLQ